jgi:hypothetical protein
MAVTANAAAAISVSRLDNMLRSPMALHRRRAWLD